MRSGFVIGAVAAGLVRALWRGSDQPAAHTPAADIPLSEPLLTADAVSGLLSIPRSSVCEYARRLHDPLPAIRIGRHITPFHFKLFAEAGIGAKQRWYRQNWMSVEFNLLYRWHSLVPDTVSVGGASRPMREAQWDTRLVTDNGLAAMFQEASEQKAYDVGILNTAEFLLDIERKSLEIGRASDLRTYNDYRQACGFPRVKRFSDISSVPEVQAALKDVYDTPDRIELFVGLFAEDVRRNAALPTLMGTMVAVDAFSQALTNPLLAEGIFNEDTLSPEGMRIFKATGGLGDIVRRNVPDPNDDLYIGLTQRTWDGS